jgi:hypothetical protein
VPRVLSFSVELPPPVLEVENVKVVESSHQSAHEVYNPEAVADEPSSVLTVIETVNELVVPVKVIVGFHSCIYVIVAENALVTLQETVLKV